MTSDNVWYVKQSVELEEKVILHFRKEGYWNNVIWHDAEFLKNKYGKNSYDEYYKSHDFAKIPDKIYDKIYNHLYTYIDMYVRWSPWSSDIYDQKNIHDYVNLFNINLNFIHRLLIENGISLVIFNRAPHLGGDYLLYLLAHELGIKTLLLDQSKFPNKFFHFFDFWDYGDFNTSKIISPRKKIEVEKKYKKDLWYMDEIYDKKKKSIRNYLRRTLRDEYRLIIESFNYRGWEQSLYRYSLRKKFKKNISNIVDDNIDYSLPYIYFALHKQPEQTTSAWGGKYADQLLAIERLSSLIPKDWFIYVKENPAQNFYMRGEYFFKRISKIPNVKVVPISKDTYELLDGSIFAATVTGTVGWEAITGGKNILVFGWGVWYKSLPGVFQYENNLNINDIIDYQIDHNELTEAVSDLQTKMCDGVVYTSYNKFYKEYDKKENVINIINAYKKILYE